MERRERSTLIKNRIVQIVELGELDYDHEIEIVQFLADHLADRDWETPVVLH